uniref:Uncharacterized protein n=1 Tax=Oryza brachyantha TaxID=4533 RepID=J3MUR7_ORYBR
GGDRRLSTHVLVKLFFCAQNVLLATHPHACMIVFARIVSSCTCDYLMFTCTVTYYVVQL